MTAAVVREPDFENPIRGELYSTERLEQYAEALAGEHLILPGRRRGRPLLPRLEENGRVLLASYRSIARAMRRETAVSPAAEWLVDNFHIVEDQLREIREDLPSGFYRELPKLANSPLAGTPRVYAISWAFVEHTDSRFDGEALRRFVRAYQRATPLTIGELWATAISLRLVLVENLRRLVEGVDRRGEARQRADAIADGLLGTGGQPPADAARVFEDLRSRPLPRAFLVQLFSRLRDQDPAVTPALQWLNRRLEEEGTTAEEVVRLEHQAQVATHVTVRNVITSMRLLSVVDWNDFFESVSAVEEALREGTRVAEMDFATRDRYRRAVEELSRGSGVSEVEIARRAVWRARQASHAGAPARLADPGYYLISRGRAVLEEELGYRVPARRWLRRAWIGAATPGYLGSLLLLTGAFVLLPVAISRLEGSAPWAILVLALLSLIPASDLAVAVINRDVTDLVGPRRLPKLELAHGVPESLRTLVAVPILLTSEGEVAEAVERLEVHYLSNSEGDVVFALLSDWTDAAGESAPDDDALLGAALEGIASLNAKHGKAPDGGNRFHLFHRRRLWNEHEALWMGWERKRGKLHELNRLLRGATDTTFLPLAGGAVGPPSGVRYVVTLDADTRLPRDAVRRLVGAMAHPLNEPTFDEASRRVVEGHGVMQPRVTPTLPAAGSGTFYQRLFSGPRGIDPYAFAVSDVYQDLFGEGIYTGKGIYDVDAFEKALTGRVPENALLSHDLFEGLFARAGLVTDIEIFEEFPGHYEVSASRQHRWARGDWQLLPWIFGRIPDARGGPVANPIPAIGRWKMIDNLRRSLSAPSAVAALAAAWILPGVNGDLWTALIGSTIALPGLFSIFSGLLPGRRGIAKRTFLRSLGSDLALWLGQLAVRLILLAHQAWLMTDAIVRTLWRLVTRRHLLEWVPAAQARRALDLRVLGFTGRMRWAVMLGVAVGLAVGLLHPAGWPDASAFVAAWILSPLVARVISLPPRAVEDEALSPPDAARLRRIARRTWRYFESFSGPEENWLPADNFQELPRPVIAHRTSPTNVGLGLLSTVAGNDLGWIGMTEMLERLEASLATMDKLQRFRGHFYNWYDTQTLEPLEPRYISTVDSGNLAGHLIVLRHACLERVGASAVSLEALGGVADALDLFRQSAMGLAAGRREGAITRRQLDSALQQIQTLLSPQPRTSLEWIARFRELAAGAETLVDTIQAMALDLPPSSAQEAIDWARAISATIASHRRDLEATQSWARPPGALSGEAARTVEALGEADMSLESAPDLYEKAALELAALSGSGNAPSSEISNVIADLERSAQAAAALTRRLAAIARAASRIVDEMDFTFLYDPERKLFSIGYRLTDGRLDPGYYDLLASESRLASFIAIARGNVPASHWFKLGRPLTPIGNGSALVSWSGSMFEYLMPELVLEAPGGSLIDHTNRLVVGRQIRYGQEHGIPWGISESAFNARDLEFIYQYSNFGVSGLGLKRGLSEDLVVAPYATALAAMLEPRGAVKNFERLDSLGAAGRYGYYESLDYTRARLPEGEKFEIVRAFMAHHQGMTIVALDNVLLQNVMRARFHAEPAVQATELLLQERTPRAVAVARPRAEEVGTPLHVRDFVLPVLRRFTSPHHPIPRTHVLSNGRYSVMVTAAGSGYSRWRDRDVTRWREDVTRDCWGTYVFLRDAQSGRVWSAGYQPSGAEPEAYEAVFSEDRVEIHRRDANITMTTQIVVSPEDDAEIRQVSLTNLSARPREIEVTSFAELVLAPFAVDAAHPAFSKLFVQTEFLPGLEALVASRRPRDPDEKPMWVAHIAAVEGETVGAVQYETDRARFLGRGRDIAHPASMEEGRPLANTVGPVLDPIVSLRHRLRLRPGATAHVQIATIAAETREKVVALADKYREPATFERTATLAWTQAQVQLHHLGISADEAHLFQRLANRLLYCDPTLRAPSEVLARNRRGPSSLWRYGISGDVPIVLVRIDHPEDVDLVRQLLRAHEYWRLKGLIVDLVIVNEQATSYGQDLRAVLESLVRTRQRAAPDEGPGRIFLLRADLLASSQEVDLLRAAARVVLLSRHGTLSEQVVRLLKATPATRPPRTAPPRSPAADTPPPQLRLDFFNGLGGFTDGGREYVTILGERQWTPAPWINVVANPQFGFLASECGSGYTWRGNSRLNQLTAWSNDPVSDPPGEALLLRDDTTGEIWGPTALPVRDEWPYVARHGQGYSRFEHDSRGIRLELLQLVPPQDPVKISCLTVENRSGTVRHLTVAAYAEWALSAQRGAAAPFIVTARDTETGALLARNPWNEEFPHVAFADLSVAGAPGADDAARAWTCDRSEFLGRNGGLDAPAGLAPGVSLSGRTGAGLDPCAAQTVTLRLAPGARASVRFLLGQADDEDAVRRLVRRYRSEDSEACLAQVTRQWDDILGALQIQTPDRSMDIVVNRWLLYQALACRIWGRSAFYQAGGAFGFRDQLQDVMALAVARREVTRAQILASAARQFLEGDVQHWWHVPSGKGIRTHMSDDLLWLPYAVTHYMEVTGDRAILEERVPFLEGDALQPEEAERYFAPRVSAETGTLFEHCARALDRSLAVGRHGLPLMGTGDWNDGMNRVGREGKGESIWLGWFLHTNLWEFSRIAEERGEIERARRWRENVDRLKIALESAGWDGDWYRRAFFDDGSPLGSAQNTECRIDSIAQSWAVISGAGDAERGRRAMAAVEEYLVRRGDGLVLLFTPPFDKSPADPGYIKGYLPGIRENGGQYTHASIWAVIAFAAQHDGDKAGELFAILNPINHASTRAGMHRYRVEPYVAAADVYSMIPHVGRGGWTWYTGSAGWMYRAAVEWILGFRLRGAALHLDPCVPRAWRGYRITFRYHSARYELEVENPHGATCGIASVDLDGLAFAGGAREIPLVDDGRMHRIRVVLGAEPEPKPPGLESGAVDRKT